MLQSRSFQVLSYGGTQNSIIRPKLHASMNSILASKLRSYIIPMAAASSSSSFSSISTQPQRHVSAEDIETLIAYHDRTKHFFNKYADGPRGLDWANQPNPFRRYNGSKPVTLLHLPPLPETSTDKPYSAVFAELTDPQPLSQASISQVLYDSFALSAWKTAGSSTWSLRVNPSSGNLHPTEAYLVSGPVAGIADTPYVAHYMPKEHTIEIRAEIPSDVWHELRKGFPENTIFVGLTSIFWREAWKYGERAFRYCNHDIGHALGAIAMAASGLGWDSVLVDGWGSDDLDQLLGVAGRKTMPRGASKRGHYPELEHEHADCLVALFPGKGDFSTEVLQTAAPSKDLASFISSRMTAVKWMGKPNQLSKEHVWWDVIDKAASASRKPLTHTILATKSVPQPCLVAHSYKPLTLRQIIHKRRSAVNMDGKFSLGKEEFYQIMCKAMPSSHSLPEQCEQQQLPFRILPWKPELHMAIFVHRVIGLPRGLYFLVRNSDHELQLRKCFRPEFQWSKPEKCPGSLPLYRLVEGDCEKLAMQLSCFQEIAGLSCFSLGMIARFEVLNEQGAWMYPRLFWESGLLGQLLYLEAHALGISATGIGCYFDDPVHQILGIQGKEFQSLYHFTVGAPVEDKRIMSLPPYPGPNVDS